MMVCAILQYMKKSCLILLCVFLCGSSLSVFSDDLGVFAVNPPAPSRHVAVRGLMATGYSILSNVLLMSFNIAVYNLSGGEMFTWATPNAASIRRNLTGPWQWEDDNGFFVNQIGHPYQGSMYFVAGRVNEFGFYQSVLFSVIGSATWEIFFENHVASINDFITTVPASMSMGEMLYRLYAEAIHAGVPGPVAFFINPMAGFHRLVTGWQPPDYGRNLHRVRFHLAPGFARTRYTLPDYDEDLFSFRGFYGELGVRIIYGDPFVSRGRVPFSHFDLNASFGLDIGNFVNFRIASDGYLFSFSPLDTDTQRMTTGLSLHMDTVSIGRLDNFSLEEESATINQYSNALNWTVKYQRLFSNSVTLETKFHLGVTFFGASVFFCPERAEDLKNYGAGFNGKLFFNLDHPRLGRLETSAFAYNIWSFPGTSDISGGMVYWLFADAAYFFPVTERFSVGLSYSFALEHGIFNNFPNTWKHHNAVRLLAAWNF